MRGRRSVGTWLLALVITVSALVFAFPATQAVAAATAPFRKVAIAGLPDGSAQLVAIGADGGVYHRVRRPDGTWTGFAGLNGVGTSGTAVASSVAIAGMPDGSAQVAIIGADGGIYHRIRYANGTWSEFQGLNGQGTPATARGTDVAIAGLPDGSAQVVAVSTDGGIYHRVRYANGSWSDFAGLNGLGTPATALGTDVAIAGFPSGATRIVVVSVDGGIYQRVRFGSGAWSEFSGLNGAGTSNIAHGSDVAVAGLPDGSTQVLAVGPDGLIYHRLGRADGTWTEFAGLNGLGTSATAAGSDVAITGLPNGSAEVAVIGPDGVIYTRSRRADGWWNEFAALSEHASTFTRHGATPKIVETGSTSSPEPGSSAGFRGEFTLVGDPRYGHTVRVQYRAVNSANAWVQLQEWNNVTDGQQLWYTGWTQYEYRTVVIRSGMPTVNGSIVRSGWGEAFSDEFTGAKTDAQVAQTWNLHAYDSNGANANPSLSSSAWAAVDQTGDGTIDLKVVPNSTGPNKTYSASLDTIGRHEFDRAQGEPIWFAARVKVHRKNGSRDSLWLRNKGDGSHFQEVDIYEHFGANSGVKHNVYWGTGDGGPQFGCAISGQSSYNCHHQESNTVSDPAGRYVIFAVEWTAAGYRFFVNGENVRTSRYFSSAGPNYILISNLAALDENVAALYDRTDPGGYVTKVDWVKTWR